MDNDFDFALIIFFALLLTAMLPISRMHQTQKWIISGNICWILYTIPATLVGFGLWIGALFLSDSQSMSVFYTVGMLIFMILLWPSLSTYWLTSFKIYQKINNKILFVFLTLGIQIIPPICSIAAIRSDYFNWINISFYSDLPN